MTTEKPLSCLDCGKPRGTHPVFTGYCPGCADRHAKKLSALNAKMSGLFGFAAPPAPKRRGR